MWIFTETGFYSIVESTLDPEDLVVRARVRQDLELLLLRHLDPEWDRPRIFATPMSDYPFRFVARRTVVSTLILRASAAIDYDNFKDRVGQTQGHGRSSVYLGVWAHLSQELDARRGGRG